MLRAEKKRKVCNCQCTCDATAIEDPEVLTNSNIHLCTIYTNHHQEKTVVLLRLSEACLIQALSMSDSINDWFIQTGTCRSWRNLDRVSNGLANLVCCRDSSTLFQLHLLSFPLRAVCLLANLEPRADTEMLSLISSFSQTLTTLSFNSTLLRDIDQIAICHKLKYLELDGCAALQSLNGLRRCTSLVRLSLSGCVSLVNLEPLALLCLLRELILWGCTSIKSIAALSALNSLTDLDLGECSTSIDLRPLTDGSMTCLTRVVIPDKTIVNFQI